MEILLNIPEALSDIKVKDFQKFKSFIKEGVSEEFVNIKAFEIFLDIGYKEYHIMKMKDREVILGALSKVFESKPALKQTFVMGEVEYGLIPDWDNITFKEFFDLSGLKETVEDGHKILSILYRPITKKKGKLYDIEPYNGYGSRQLIMKEVPSDILVSVLFFCRQVSKTLLSLTGISSLQAIQTKIEHSMKFTELGVWSNLRLMEI